jgi:23S rRNA pseudouridine1911/1915/1917 synthase
MNKKYDNYICTEELSRKRVDLVLSILTGFSRSKVIYYIKNGLVLKNNIKINKGSVTVEKNDVISVFEYEKDFYLSTENNLKNIKIEIIFENENFIVINKPPFVAVHSSNINDKSYTISDWIKENKIWKDVIPDCDSEKERVGIVHRLDKETSGILIIAKNNVFCEKFKYLFKNRLIKKTYIAYVDGNIQKEGIINEKIIRDPNNPTKMICNKNNGRDAETKYLLIERYNSFNKVFCFPKTGRTHQIRVHLSHIGVPILGDKVYGRKSNLINRHALHAFKIEFEIDSINYVFEIELPDDMKNLSYKK